MKHHAKYDEVKSLIEVDIPVLLTGQAGSGKTTLVKQVAEDLELKFFSISLTRQTTLSHLLGFMSVNGTYVPSSFRECFQHGGLMLLDEIDAGDPNVLLAFNTIENGYISFPDGLVNCHEDFRLAATANPQDQHNFYTGRSKLDAATLDRFDIIDVERDNELEMSLVDLDTYHRMEVLRSILKENNAEKQVSMRDSLRYQLRKNLNMLNDNFIYRLTNKSDLILEQYNAKVAVLPKHRNQSDCETIDDLINLVKTRAGDNAPSKPQAHDEESQNDNS